MSPENATPVLGGAPGPRGGTIEVREREPLLTPHSTENSDSADASETTCACPVCDCLEHDVYFQGGSEDRTSESVGPSRIHQRPGTVLRCKCCGLGFRELRPDVSTLAKLYEGQDVETYLSEIPGRRWTARRHWDLVKPLMLRGNLLDIGCASGLFLGQVLRAGWTATGIEPSQALCHHAREQMGKRIKIVCGTLESSDLPSDSFDVVTLWDVLEHTLHPADFLRASARLLKPGGYILLNVPHLDSRPARVLGRRWPLLLPEHLCYFSRDSLLRCAESAGLSWERFDRRSAIFSLGHVVQRLGEHEIPFTATLKALVTRFQAEEWLVPMPLGEIAAVFRKPVP